jgi:hypothetical protein
MTRLGLRRPFVMLATAVFLCSSAVRLDDWTSPEAAAAADSA